MFILIWHEKILGRIGIWFACPTSFHMARHGWIFSIIKIDELSRLLRRWIWWRSFFQHALKINSCLIWKRLRPCIAYRFDSTVLQTPYSSEISVTKIRFWKFHTQFTQLFTFVCLYYSRLREHYRGSSPKILKLNKNCSKTPYSRFSKSKCKF